MKQLTTTKHAEGVKPEHVKSHNKPARETRWWWSEFSEEERERDREDKPEAEARTVDLVPVDDVFIAFDELFINI